MWVHADAAYGGFFRLVPGGDALMPRIDECDSITLDPHKGLFLPYGTGCLLVREPAMREHVRRAAPGDSKWYRLIWNLKREQRKNENGDIKAAELAPIRLPSNALL